MFDLSKVGLKGKDLVQGKTTEALDNYWESEDKIVEDFNRRAATLSHDIDKFNNQWGFLQTRERAVQLRDSLKDLMEFQKNFTDPQQISRQNQAWLSNTLKLLEEEGGAFSGDLKAQAIDGYLLAEENGIRIAENKIRQHATLTLDKFDSQFRQAIAENDIGGALELQQEREAIINNLVVEGVYSTQEAEAYLANTKETFADAIIVKSLEDNNYLEFSDSQAEALKDMKRMKTMYSSFFNNASDRVKTNFLRRFKYLQDQMKQSSFVDLTTRQREYANAMRTWSYGGATSKETIERGDLYIRQLKRAISLGQIKPSSLSKVRSEIEETQISNRLIGDVAKAGAAMNDASFNIAEHPIIDKNVPISEVIKTYGYPASSPAAKLIADIRQTLPFIKEDNVLSNVETYKFIKGTNGEQHEVPNIQDVNDLSGRIAKERKIDRLMGGSGTISSYTSDAFNHFQQSGDPNVETTLEQVIAESPADFLPEVSRHRSKPENTVTSTNVVEFVRRNKQIFNFSESTFSVIRNDIAYNQNAKSAYNKIFNFVEANYNREVLHSYAELQGIGAQQIISAVSAYVLRQMSEGLAQEDDSYALLNHSLSNLNTKKPTPTLQAINTITRDIMNDLLAATQVRGKVNVTDSTPLQNNSSEG